MVSGRSRFGRSGLKRPSFSTGLGHNNNVLFWAMLLNELSMGFYSTLLPLYIESLGASPGQVGLVIGMQGVVRLMFIAPAGWLADRFPLGRLIPITRSMTAIGVLLYAVAGTWWHLLPIIVLASIGNIAFPAISKVIADSSDDAGRTRAFTLIYTVGPSTALLLSPSLGGVIGEAVSLRAVFVAAAIAQVASVVCFMRLRVQSSSSASAGGGGYWAVLRFRPIVAVCGLFLFMLLVLTVGFTLVPNFLQDVHGVSVRTIGLFGSVFALGAVTMGLVIARVPRFSRPMDALVLTMAVTPLAFVFLLLGSSTPMFALSYFCRAGYLVGWGVVYAVLGEVTPSHLRSRSFAMAELLGGFGFAIAPFIAGALYEVDPALPLIAALVGVAPMLLALLLVRRYVLRLAPLIPEPIPVPAT